ncbi:hypothetical protein LCM10_01500 [Rossellomorea aquimaris]|uniref:hypothetical protein n=1 Tax=Rossellomorea aquimaris TaxID=189382 RepID=UPI001CD3DE31|nr:hypothetical protein [Rossellomorea aquimaris]MCA1053645.1 hypothetical protein [Rossellomorea aquimaris]
MISLKEQLFENADDLYSAIKGELNKHNIDIESKVDHNYHFIIEIATRGIRIGRISVYYNKVFKCTSARLIHPVEPQHYEILSTILPIKKKNVIEYDPYIEYLENNYQIKILKILDGEKHSSYEVKIDNKEVWVKIIKNVDSDLECQYLKGDFNLFDYVQYLFEGELSFLSRPKTLTQ